MAPSTAGTWRTLLIYGTVTAITLLAILPSIGVVLTALAGRWVFTPLPSAYTTEYLQDVWSNHIAVLSIRNSVLYSAASTCLDIVCGVAIAWLIARRPSWLTSVLDGLATLPLALPGLVLAFGYLTCYSNWNFGASWGPALDPARQTVNGLLAGLNPIRNPVPSRQPRTRNR